MTSEVATTVGKLAGSAPNEIWMRTGQVLGILGAGSMVGFHVGDFGFGQGANYAPLLLVLLGGFAMWYGTKTRRIAHIAQQEHEIKVALVTLGTTFPHSASVDAFVVEVLKKPMTREQLAHAEPFTGFTDLTEEQLIGLLHQCFAERGMLRGSTTYDHELGRFHSTLKTDETDDTVVI